jgi:chaperonin cofactor prefoldin
MQEVAVVIGILTGAVVLWKAAVSVAKSVLQKELEDKVNKIINEMEGMNDKIDRTETRVDKLYDRLIQKNS